MLRVADADAAAVVDRNPGCARRGVQQRVQQRPIGDCVRAVQHGFRLAIGRSDRAGVQMIAADDDGRFDLAATHVVVHRESELGALAITEPADARGQALEVDAVLRQAHPARENRIVGEEFERQAVRGADIFGRARERDPTKRTAAFAEQRADVLGNEAGNFESVFDARGLGLRADVVAVVERDRAHSLQREHGADVLGHGVEGAAHIFVRIRAAQSERFLQGHSVRARSRSERRGRWSGP